MSNRVKMVREALNLSQREFGEKLGVSRDVISNIEYGRVQPKELLLQHICQLYRVNPHWLETGEGEMFLPSPNGVLDELVQKYGLSTRGKVIVEKFLDLNPDVQEAVAVYIEKVAAAFSDAGTSAPVPVFAPADLRAEHTATESEDPELEAEVEAYRQRRLQEKRPGLQTSAVKGRGAV